MKKMKYVCTVTFFVILTLASGLCFAEHGRRARTYAVTITNLTRGQIFSPPIVISHNRNFSLFTLGEPASDQLYPLAEDGDTGPLIDSFDPSSVFDHIVGTNILPGDSLTLEITTRPSFKYISAAGMLVTTNDAFFAIRDVEVPLRGKVKVEAEAYDAGSEANSEDCSFIPGPPCGNVGVRDEVGAEGYVYIHAGIHDGAGPPDGVDPMEHDWRNPVAQITIRRIR